MRGVVKRKSRRKCWDRKVRAQEKPFLARCHMNGKRVCIGQFRTEQEAHKAYLDFRTSFPDARYSAGAIYDWRVQMGL